MAQDEESSYLKVPPDRARTTLSDRQAQGQALADSILRTTIDTIDLVGLDSAQIAYAEWDEGNIAAFEAIFGGSSVVDDYLERPPELKDPELKLCGKFFQLVHELNRKIRQLESVATRIESLPSKLEVQDRRVFVVHGHEARLRESVARLLTSLGLEPIILHEQSNIGRTVIEKFEAHADVGFAVVLLTGDDVGRARSANVDSSRARQNVVFELGYFFGRLGRARVCTIYETGVELPSDVRGLVYVEADSAGAWKMALAQELASVGYDIDFNRLFRRS